MNKRLKFPVAAGAEKDFWRAASKDIKSLFSSNKKRVGGYRIKVKTAILFSILCLGLYIIFAYGAELSWWPLLIYTLVIAPTAASIGMNVMHEGSHGTFSSKKWLNNLASYTSILFVGGIPDNWRVEHVVLHHPNTNIYGKDCDFSTAEPAIRFSKYSVWKKLHKLQKYNWYIFLVYCQMTLYWVFATDIKQTTRYLELKQQGASWKYPSKTGVWLQFALCKLFVLLFWIFLPIWLGMNPWVVITGFILMHQVLGMILSHIFQPAHINAETEKYHINTMQPRLSSKAHQFVTSMDYATDNWLLTEFCGGLNYQRVHHLYQSITHEHYPAITRIIRKHYESFRGSPGFKLEYKEFKTLWEAIKANYAYVRQQGHKISFEV